MFNFRINNVSNNSDLSSPLEMSSTTGFKNSIHPDYGAGGHPTRANFSPEDMHKVVMGSYEGDKIVAYGITHYKYSDCRPQDLVDVGGVKVHKKTQEAFQKMQKAAQKDGVNIRIVSGFRSEKYQITVFKKKFADKNYPTQEEFKARLCYSAPSGFSEHHTGLAIDINFTEESFANTPEYRWLQEHAHEYGFEMSFPKDGKQGLGFEPWHWRYIGDEESREVFKAARENL